MKKILAVALTAVMAITVFTGCKGDGAGSSGKLPAATITVLFEGSNVSDDAAVIEKVNERLKELGTNVSFKGIWGTWGDFEPKATNALDTGDTSIDIYFTCSWTADNYAEYARKGLWARLDDPKDNLIDKYGKDVKKALPEALWNGFVTTGAGGETGIYGVPGYKDYAQLYTWDVNNTLLKELGFDYNSFKWNSDTFYDPQFDAAMAKAKEVKGASFYPLVVEAEVLARHINNTDADPTGLGVLYLGFDPENPAKPEKPHVTSRYDEQGYVKFINKIREYYEKGYIDPRAGNSNQANDALAAQKDSAQYLFNTQTYAYGYDNTASEQRGIDAKFPPISKTIVSTGSVQGSGYAISVYSKNKAQAMQFLNYWYTDAKLATLLNYGIEGSHYTKNSDGTVTFNQEMRDTYHPWTYGMGNIFILPAEGVNGPNFFEEFKAYNNAGIGTGFIGFTFNSDPVKNEIAALQNVVGEYQIALLSGSVDPSTQLPAFKDKLAANGLQKLIDEYNKQLDEFYKGK